MFRNTRVIIAGLILIIGLTIGLAVNLPATAQESGDLNPRLTALMITSVLKGDIITHVDTGGRKLVALTFDDGPDPIYTPEVLKILEQYKVRATFFVVGENVEANPGIVRKAIQAGHEIENHTYSHPQLNRGTMAELVAEIIGAQEVIKGLSGRDPSYFRPPKKLYNLQVINAAHASHLQVVLWSVCVENRKCPTSGKMAERVLKMMRPGTIILAHDGRLPRDKTLQALPMIIEGYQREDYTFVTLSELIAAGER